MAALVYGIKEEDIIERCVSGDRKSQELLYKFYSSRMFGICMRYANDYHHAEDVLQEGFVKVFNNIDKYRKDGSFEGWLKRIFINTAVEHYRKTQRTAPTTELENAKENTIPEDGFGNLSTADLLKMIQGLSPGYRTIFNLYAIEGYSHREIANMLEISEGTSKSQLARARQILQEMVRNSHKK